MTGAEAPVRAKPRRAAVALPRSGPLGGGDGAEVGLTPSAYRVQIRTSLVRIAVLAGLLAADEGEDAPRELSPSRMDAAAIAALDDAAVVRLVDAVRQTDAATLPLPQRPVVPVFQEKQSLRQRLAAVQTFISSFQYNFTNEQFFDVRKRRPLARVIETAKTIVRRALPIKCIEAVFLGIYLTTDMPSLDRIPVSFKSTIDGRTFRHIVLIVRSQGKYGALGLSRKRTLMDRPLKFATLADILEDFKLAYEAACHRLLSIKVGLPVEHDLCSADHVCWRCTVVDVREPWSVCAAQLATHVRREDYLRMDWRAHFQRTTSASGKRPARPEAAAAAAPAASAAADADAAEESDEGEDEAAAAASGEEAPTRFLAV